MQYDGCLIGGGFNLQFPAGEAAVEIATFRRQGFDLSLQRFILPVVHLTAGAYRGRLEQFDKSGIILCSTLDPDGDLIQASRLTRIDVKARLPAGLFELQALFQFYPVIPQGPCRPVQLLIGTPEQPLYPPFRGTAWLCGQREASSQIFLQIAADTCKVD